MSSKPHKPSFLPPGLPTSTGVFVGSVAVVAVVETGIVLLINRFFPENDAFAGVLNIALLPCLLAPLVWLLAARPFERATVVRQAPTAGDAWPATPVALLVLNRECQVLRANAAAEGLLAETEDELRGKSLFAWLEEAEAPSEAAPPREASLTGRPLRYHRGRLRQPGNQWLPVEYALASMTWEGLPAYIAVLLDLSSRLGIEERLQQELANATAGARATDRFLTQQGVNLRAASTTGLRALNSLGRTALTAEQRDQFSTVRRLQGRLLNSLDAGLELVSLRSAPPKLELRAFDLRQVAQAALEVVADEAAARRVQLVSAIAPDVPRGIRGDADRFGQVLVHLLRYAISASGQGEVALEVAAEAQGNSGFAIGCAVRDASPGLAPAQLVRLIPTWDALTQGEAGDYTGEAVGLAIAKTLAELQGGQLVAESEPGKGTVLRFRLVAEGAAVTPAAPSEPDTRALPEVSSAATPGSDEGASSAPSQRRTPRTLGFGSAPPGRPLTVLVAEGNDLDRQLALQALEQLGHAADPASAGAEVLQAVEERGYDAVLLDLDSAAVRGQATAAALRQRPGRVSWLIGLTRRSELGGADAPPAGTVDDCLTKPLRKEGLARALLRSGAAQATAAPAAPSAPGPPVEEPEKWIELGRLMKLGGNAPGEAAQLAELYLEQTARDLEELGGALARSDLPATQRAAVRALGASSNAGMVGMALLLRQLGEAAKQGDVARAQTCLRLAERGFDRTRRDLQAGGLNLARQTVAFPPTV